MRTVLGLDVSTSIAGGCIMDVDTLEILSLFAVDMRKDATLVQKARHLARDLEAYTAATRVVGIEAPLMMFAAGGSSAQVISLLSQMNGMAQLISANLFNVEPVMVNVATARKLAFPDLKFPKGLKRKLLVQQRVAKEYPGIEWKRKKTGTLADECFDMADAIVIARAMATMNRSKG